MLHIKREIRGNMFQGMRPGEWSKAMSYEEQLLKEGRFNQKERLGKMCSLND